MKNIDWSAVQEASDGRLTPGGYICGIVTAEDFPDKEYLRIEFDIAEGDQKNYFLQMRKRMNLETWPYDGSFIKSYKEKARPFFKAFVTSLELSNRGYRFNNDENTLPRKLFGAVLAEEEYLGNDGKIKTRLYVHQIRSVAAIREGNYTVPDLKRYTPSTGSAAPAVTAPANNYAYIPDDDADLPF